MKHRYVFTWAGVRGPEARFFDEARYLLAFAAGWQGGCLERGQDGALLLDAYEVRA